VHQKEYSILFFDSVSHILYAAIAIMTSFNLCIQFTVGSYF